MAMARKFAAGPPLALAAAKRAIDEGLDLPLTEGLALESRLFAELFDTEDQKTGMRSFLENGRARPPSPAAEPAVRPARETRGIRHHVRVR